MTTSTTRLGLTRCSVLAWLGSRKPGLGLQQTWSEDPFSLLVLAPAPYLKVTGTNFSQAVSASAGSKLRHPEFFPGRLSRGLASRRGAPSSTTPSTFTGKRCSRGLKVGTLRSHSWGRNSSNHRWSTFFSHPNHPHCVVFSFYNLSVFFQTMLLWHIVQNINLWHIVQNINVKKRVCESPNGFQQKNGIVTHNCTAGANKFWSHR